MTEHGHRFTVDLAGAYFSARLSTERQRILAQVQEGETVLDMFAGVGPFAITLAAKAGFVVAVDLNPQAVGLMLENLARNRARNVLPLLADARRLSRVLPWKFDRIVMNLPLAGTEFLPDAFRLIRPGGTIHFYSLVSGKGEHTGPDTGTGRDRARRTGGAVVLPRAVACSLRHCCGMIVFHDTASVQPGCPFGIPGGCGFQHSVFHLARISPSSKRLPRNPSYLLRGIFTLVSEDKRPVL